jgi:hypothetical protein
MKLNFEKFRESRGDFKGSTKRNFQNFGSIKFEEQNLIKKSKI